MFKRASSSNNFIWRIGDPNDNIAPKDLDGRVLNFLNVGTGKDISIKELVKKINNERDF